MAKQMGCNRSLAKLLFGIALGILLLSESVAAMATAKSISIAQQAETPSQDANRAAAEQLEREDP